MTTNEMAGHVLRLDQVYCSLLMRLAKAGPTVTLAKDELNELALDFARCRRVLKDCYELKRVTEKRK